MTPQLDAACAHAVHVVAPDGRTLRAGRAALFLLGVAGWRRTSRLLRLPPLIWLVEIAYRVVANNRPFFGQFVFRNAVTDPALVGDVPDP